MREYKLRTLLDWADKAIARNKRHMARVNKFLKEGTKP